MDSRFVCIILVDEKIQSVHCRDVQQSVLDIMKKSIFYNNVIECGKRCQNIFIWVKKKNCLGVFKIEEIRDQDNETGLKEGG